MWTAGWGTVWGPWWGCSTLNCGEPGEKPRGRTPLEEITRQRSDIKQESDGPNVTRELSLLSSRSLMCYSCVTFARFTHGPWTLTHIQLPSYHRKWFILKKKKNQLCSFPRWVTGHFHPQKESQRSWPAVMKSRGLSVAGRRGWGGVVSGYYDGGGIRLQLVSFQPDVPVLQFTFLCCVVILATLISVLHFILTSKGNMLVKFHWISGPFSGPPRLVCAFWHLPSTLASAAVHERTVTFKNIAEPQRLI